MLGDVTENSGDVGSICAHCRWRCRFVEPKERCERHCDARDEVQLTAACVVAGVRQVDASEVHVSNGEITARQGTTDADGF